MVSFSVPDWWLVRVFQQRAVSRRSEKPCWWERSKENDQTGITDILSLQLMNESQKGILNLSEKKQKQKNTTLPKRALQPLRGYGAGASAHNLTFSYYYPDGEGRVEKRGGMHFWQSSRGINEQQDMPWNSTPWTQAVHGINPHPKQLCASCSVLTKLALQDNQVTINWLTDLTIWLDHLPQSHNRQINPASLNTMLEAIDPRELNKLIETLNLIELERRQKEQLCF